MTRQCGEDKLRNYRCVNCGYVVEYRYDLTEIELGCDECGGLLREIEA